MTQKWKFKIDDPDNQVEFEVTEGDGKSIVVTKGKLENIFTNISGLQELLGITPKIIGLMKINTINKLEVEEEAE